MHKLRHTPATSKKLFLSIAALTALAIPIAFSPAHAKPVQVFSRSQQRSICRISNGLAGYVGVKPLPRIRTAVGDFTDTDDGVTGFNVPLVYLVRYAYGIYEDYRYSGVPGWISSENYDVDAKMESSVAEAFRKLPKAQRILAEHHML